MSQRLEFIHAVIQQRLTMRAACRQFGISQKAGYKWLDRFTHGGPDALADRAPAPMVPANQRAAAVRAQICQLRDAHPTWGARKLRAPRDGLTHHPGLALTHHPRLYPQRARPGRLVGCTQFWIKGSGP